MKIDNQPSRGTYHFNRDDTSYLTTTLTNNDDENDDIDDIDDGFHDDIDDNDNENENNENNENENDENDDNENDKGKNKKKKKQNWFTKAKKGVMSKATSSSAGKALFNKFVDKETKNLINSLCIIEEKEEGYEKSKQMKTDIYRIAVKIIMLYQDKFITERDFGNIKSQFRKVCSSLKNGFRTGILEETTAQRIESNIIDFCSSTKNLITPFLTDHTLNRLDRLQGTLGNLNWLMTASKFDEFNSIVYACAHYLEQIK